VPVTRVILILVLCLATDLPGQVPDSLRPAGGAVTDSSATQVGDSSGTPSPVITGLGSLPSPGSTVTVLTDSAIIFSGYRSPSDLLGSLPGVFVIESGEGGFDRLQSVHGLRPGSMVFLADGLLLNDPSTGLFSAGIYPVAFAGRFEIVPSGAGALYGPGGVGGAVNFVSRGIRAVRPVSGIQYSQSSYGYSTLDAAVTQDVSRRLNVSVGITRPSYDGRYPNAGVDAWKARVKIRYDMDGASVYVTDRLTRWNRGLNGGISAATPDTLIYDRIRAVVENASATGTLVRHDLAAGIAFGSEGDSAALTMLDLQFSSNTRRYIDEAGGTGSTGTPFRDTRREQSTGFRLAHSRRLGAQRVSGGVEMRNRRLLEDPRVGGHRTVQGALFARLELKPFPSLSLFPGARLDRTMDLTRFSAGVDAAFTPVASVTVRGSASRSHRFPSFIEAFGIQSVALPLTVNDAERHDLLSGGVTIGDSGGTFFSADVFHRSVAGAVTLDSASGTGQPTLAFRRAEESREGVSAHARLVVGSIMAEADADLLLYGGDVTYRYAPRWSLGSGLYFRDRLVGGHLDLKAGLRGRYFTAYDGGRLSRRYETYIPSDSRVPPAGTIDIVLVAGIGDAFIHFIWENLLDRDYFMEVLYPANDRSIRFGVTWSFLD